MINPDEPYSTAYKIVTDSEVDKPYIEITNFADSNEKFYINETSDSGIPTVLEYDFEPGWTFNLNEEDNTCDAIVVDDAKYQQLIDEHVKDEDITIHGMVLQDCGEGFYLITSNGTHGNNFHVYAPGCSLKEDDNCTIEGKMDGVYTYESISGEIITIPKLLAEKVELKE